VLTKVARQMLALHRIKGMIDRANSSSEEIEGLRWFDTIRNLLDGANSSGEESEEKTYGVQS
jgi:uncharacterized protein with von Willebrand factor type A (vWA) domain